MHTAYYYYAIKVSANSVLMLCANGDKESHQLMDFPQYDAERQSKLSKYLPPTAVTLLFSCDLLLLNTQYQKNWNSNLHFIRARRRIVVWNCQWNLDLLLLKLYCLRSEILFSLVSDLKLSLGKIEANSIKYFKFKGI